MRVIGPHFPTEQIAKTPFSLHCPLLFFGLALKRLGHLFCCHALYCQKSLPRGTNTLTASARAHSKKTHRASRSPCTFAERCARTRHDTTTVCTRRANYSASLSAGYVLDDLYGVVDKAAAEELDVGQYHAHRHEKPHLRNQNTRNTCNRGGTRTEATSVCA